VRNIAEFNAAADAHTRRLWIAIAFSIAGTFVVFGIAGLCRPALLESLSGQIGEVGAEVSFGAVPLVAVLVFLTGMWLGYRRGGRDPRLYCPYCRKMLFETRSIVVATRNCVRCGKRVLAEPE
jgi:hypothetical protein